LLAWQAELVIAQKMMSNRDSFFIIAFLYRTNTLLNGWTQGHRRDW
jgi:hypothetical protein